MNFHSLVIVRLLEEFNVYENIIFIFVINHMYKSLNNTIFTLSLMQDI